MTPETTEVMTRYLLETTLKAMGHVHAVLELVPDEHLDDQPVPEQLPLGKMIEHVYGAVAFTSRSIRRGRCDEGDVADLMTDNDATGTRPRIKEVEAIAREEIQAALAELDADMASRTIDYWFGWSLTGLETAGLGYEELCHHRGQLQSFLRLLGHVPPDIHTPAEAAEEALA